MTTLALAAFDPATLTLDEVEASLRRLAQVPIGPMLEALERLAVDVALPDAAAIAGALAPFFPEARLAQLAILALLLVIHGYETGAIRSADPSAPAMMRAAGVDQFSD